MKLGDIKKNYPKAYGLLEEKGLVDGEAIRGGVRELYDFFDSLKVCVSITVYEIGTQYEINQGQYAVYSGLKFNSRKQAENVAFKKAFKLLEHEL